MRIFRPGQLDCLGHVALEVQSEGAAVGERLDLPAQVFGQRGVGRVELAEQVVEPGHRFTPGFAVGETVERATGERGEDALVGLARELAVAGLAERRAGPGRRLAEQRVEAGSGHHQQAVGRAGAGDRETAEGRVELVELRRPGQRVDRDRDPVGLALPGVDRRG